MKNLKSFLTLTFCLSSISLAASAQDQRELQRVMCEAYPTGVGCPGHVEPPADDVDAVMSVQAHYDNTTGRFFDYSYPGTGFSTLEQCKAYNQNEFDTDDRRAVANNTPRPQRYGESVVNFPGGTIWYGCVLKSLVNSSALSRYMKVTMDLKTAQSMKMVPFSTAAAAPAPSNRGLPYVQNPGAH